MSDVAAGREHGDRAAFLARIRARQGPPPTTGPHPPPPPLEVVPVLSYRSLDGLDTEDPAVLLPVFERAARGAQAEVRVVDGVLTADDLAPIVEAHAVRTASVSRDPGLDAVVEALTSLGVRVEPYERASAATADLAVTGATHAIAATGSVVVDSRSAGSRAVSLLPRVHLCVVPIDRLVPTHAEILRHPEQPLPSCRVLITGPSRTGDIEQLLTLGAHGPVAVHIVVLR